MEVSFLLKAITDIKRAKVIKIIFKIQIPYLYYKGINTGRSYFYFFSPPDLICFASQSANFKARPLIFFFFNSFFWRLIFSSGSLGLADSMAQGTGVRVLLCHLPVVLVCTSRDTCVQQGRGRLYFL